jgi:hypothetical protein
MRQSIVIWQQQHPEAAIGAVKNPGDGSGLVLGVGPSHRAAGEVGQTLQQRTGVPVRVVAEEPLKPMSRGDDWSPWIGGARLWSQSAGAICTTGFGVRDSQYQDREDLVEGEQIDGQDAARRVVPPDLRF